jgi:predicted transposase/invertase (TIGR01784 family)
MRVKDAECSNQKEVMGHDAFIRKSMSRKKVAREFFEANLPEHVLRKADLSTLKLEKSDFIDTTLKEGTVDLLFSVQLNGQPGYFSLLLEHQSTSDSLMPFRIFKYMLMICDAHVTKHRKAGFPVIFPMILYTGNTKYSAPLSFWELFSDSALAKQCFCDPIQLLELRTIRDIDLQHRFHAGIVLYLMREIHRKDICPSLYPLQHLIRYFSRDDLHFVEDMLRYVLYTAESKQKKLVIDVFVGAVTENNKGKIMSIANELKQEGRQEGRQEGIEHIINNMLASNMSVSDISRVTKLPREEIEKIKVMLH